MVAILYFRLYCKKKEEEEEEETILQAAATTNEMATDTLQSNNENEKRSTTSCCNKSGRRRRNWPFLWLTAIRTCQLAYFAHLHAVVFLFDQTGYYNGMWAWYASPGDDERSKAGMRWARALSLLNLIYILITFIFSLMFRNLDPKKWRLFGIHTFFGDLLMAWSLLHILRVLHPSYTNYCYDVPRKFDYENQGILTYLGKGQFNKERYLTCALLDSIFTLGAIPALSHIASIIATTCNIRRATNQQQVEVYPKEEGAVDIEQGTMIIPPAAEPSRSQSPVSSSSRGPSPPPSYRSRSSSGATEAGRPPSYRSAPSVRARASMETVSSVDPDSYLVSDGWRAPEHPPVYSSRPPSLRDGQV
ncbi:hypothetical protein QC761_409000 [Podospora bellae-mahoneyi]|uniref:Uncharacterized protein n=1 Tax=Podospora bellae-mahoneyi TaxID=2093777 RepID=A0ABR0FJV9_9PEZI|nr:hypothetical protein QC761_409000 [Podospora bellae-mahoneyi]